MWKAVRESLQAAGTDVQQAVSDADTLTVCTAVHHIAEGRPVVVLGTDSHLLVMRVARASFGSTVRQISPGHGRLLGNVFIGRFRRGC